MKEITITECMLKSPLRRHHRYQEKCPLHVVCPKVEVLLQFSVLNNYGQQLFSPSISFQALSLLFISCPLSFDPSFLFIRSFPPSSSSSLFYLLSFLLPSLLLFPFLLIFRLSIRIHDLVPYCNKYTETKT